MIPTETITGMGQEKIKENSRDGEFKFDIFDILKELL
jgi:hypothetical protein